MAAASTTPSPDAIREEMRRVRRELGEDVDGLVDNAQVLSDWRYYVRTYPWLCLGVAAAAGFLIVPSKVRIVHPGTASIAELVRAQKPSKPARPGILATVGSMLASALLQGGMALAKQQLNKYLESQMHGRPREVHPGAEVHKP